MAFDIIEPLERHLRSRNLHAPLVLLSTAAKHSVAYANIAAEWMGDSQQARSQVSFVLLFENNIKYFLKKLN